MADDFERLCRAAWQGSCASVARFGGNAISDEHGRAIVLAVLREQALLAFSLGHLTAGNFINSLIDQAEGGQKQ